ncbi:MAG: SusC/RagA family TonB-linked outer membrane protein [Bacteroidaceae bacterium]|nr:SusC/RagA family TonB-linked outer membrane protein [Bacteroidaceae bacterium]
MIRYFYVLILLALPFSLFAQERTITGRVLDGDFDNLPLVGATVKVEYGENTQIEGTATDLDGKFSLEVSDDATEFSVSFIGYETAIVKIEAARSEYEIILRSNSNTINEVVITGYQNIERRRLTASVSTVNIADGKIGAITNIDQALAGQVAGLSTVVSNGAPGAPVKIRIRGTASLCGTQDPLWVLDGMPLEGTDIPAMEELKDIDNIYQTSIAGINPSDIENITVLKDAAATAIYGARAANGVIVITTKKGKMGKAQINVSTKLTVNPNLNLSRLNMLNSEEKVGLELDLLTSGFSYRGTKGSVYQLLSLYGMLDTYKTGGWDALSPEAQNAINTLKGINTDWNDVLMRTALSQEYNISISGGTEKANYYTSVGYNDEQGNVKGVSNNRFNITLKTDYRINKYLKLGASAYANQRKQNTYLTDYNSFTNPIYYSRIANPYQTVYDADGNYAYDKNVEGRADTDLDFNIIEERENTSNVRTDRSMMTIFDAVFNYNDMFKLTSQLGLQYDNYKLDRYAGENSYAMRYEKYDKRYNGTTYLPDGGMHKVNHSDSFQWTWKTMAEYRQTFCKAHEVEVMVGTELRRVKTESNYSVAYGYDPRTLTTIPLIFPNENIAESNPLYSETFTENAFASFFATASYCFKNRYTLGGSVRFDGSDVFGVAKEYRFLPLYSVSGLWRVIEEEWMEDAHFIDNLGIRASYGLQGNIDKNTSPYLIGKFDKTQILPGNVEDVIQAETAPNPNLRWEKTKNVNAGIDFAVLNRAISLTADYYYRKSTDLIGMRMLPLETGFSSTTINWASMENQGVEVSLATRNIYTHDFLWTTNINVGYNSNKVLQETVAENSTYPSRKGYPVGAIFAYKTAGLDEAGYPLYETKDGREVSAKEFFNLDRNGAPMMSAAEQRDLYTYMGSSDPLVSGGFINTFEYKNISLNINLTFNLGATVRVQPTYSPLFYDRGLNTNRDILDRWIVDNKNGKFPTLMSKDGVHDSEIAFYENYSSYGMLDIWVKKCNYLRCQSIRLGYKFDGDWMKKIGVRSASVSLEGRNLFVVASDYTNYLDPETMGNPYATPLPKSAIFTLNVGF